MPRQNKPQLPVHPLIAGLEEGREQFESMIKFAGYIGQSGKPGQVRLYSSLDNLSHYLEFDEEAVVQTAPASESVLPNNAVVIFLKANTPVRWIREYSTAKALRRAIARKLRNSAIGGVTGSMRPARATTRPYKA
jgi:hypothetical protein